MRGNRLNCFLPVRIDPTVGLLETLLVIEGKPISLGAHIRRLWRSAAELLGGPLPKTLVPSVRLAASALKLGRLSATVSWPSLSRPQCHVVATEVNSDDVFPPTGEGRSLHTVATDRSLGPHKWADRSWVKDLDLPSGVSVPLLVSGQTKNVLEAVRGNIFLLNKQTLVTPALDRRILPGITRLQTIKIARDMGIQVAERCVALDELFTADEVFMTGSVRGIEPISAIDGTDIRSGTKTLELATHLRRVWFQAESESISS